MSEKLSTMERSLKETKERHFVETLNVIAGHSQAVVMEAGEREGNPFTDFLFVLVEGTHTSESLRDMKVDIGLDSDVSAHITTNGSGVLVNTPISDGRVAEIFSLQNGVDDKLWGAVEEVRQKSLEKAAQVNLDSNRVITETIQASLGRTWSGEAKN